MLGTQKKIACFFGTIYADMRIHAFNESTHFVLGASTE